MIMCGPSSRWDWNTLMNKKDELTRRSSSLEAPPRGSSSAKDAQSAKKGEEMKKTYKIDVDCANCANKMEQAAKKTNGVKDAVVNFMALKMKVEFEDGADPAAVMQDVVKNCKIVEDDCEIFL